METSENKPWEAMEQAGDPAQDSCGRSIRQPGLTDLFPPPVPLQNLCFKRSCAEAHKVTCRLFCGFSSSTGRFTLAQETADKRRLDHQVRRPLCRTRTVKEKRGRTRSYKQGQEAGMKKACCLIPSPCPATGLVSSLERASDAQAFCSLVRNVSGWCQDLRPAPSVPEQPLWQRVYCPAAPLSSVRCSCRKAWGLVYSMAGMRAAARSWSAMREAASGLAWRRQLSRICSRRSG